MPILVLLAAIAFAASPFLVTDFAGYRPETLPVDLGAPLMQPAGYAFAIWGPIFLALIAQAAFGLARRRDDPAWAASRPPLLLSLAVGAAWLAVAVVSPLAASAMITVMLAGALAALAPMTERWAKAPIALYAGWLTAATAVSWGILAAGHGLVGEPTGAALVLGATLAVAAAVIARLRPGPAYGAAIAWALVAVAVQTAPEALPLAIAAGLGAAAVAALALRAA